MPQLSHVEVYFHGTDTRIANAPGGQLHAGTGELLLENAHFPVIANNVARLDQYRNKHVDVSATEAGHPWGSRRQFRTAAITPVADAIHVRLTPFA